MEKQLIGLESRAQEASSVLLTAELSSSNLDSKAILKQPALASVAFNNFCSPEPSNAFLFPSAANKDSLVTPPAPYQMTRKAPYNQVFFKNNKSKQPLAQQQQQPQGSSSGN